MPILALSELAGLIKSAIGSYLDDEYWVTAEIAQINSNYGSGHCYLELVEKRSDVTTAKMKAAIWSSNFGQIADKFRFTTGSDLQAGMKILLLARVTYHHVYGLSLHVKDIDPRYTLGEMALKRREIIERLEKEGIIDRNRQLELPPVIQRIAVISSETAAGYGDFLNRLGNNHYGYRFCHKLFQSYMQGEKAEESIGNALKKCAAQRNGFDAIIIVRGGGSVVDLHCFDSYNLARMIALCPLPVFTGIGHERDETVVDRVANKRLITPTAVAEFLIFSSRQFEERINGLGQGLTTKTNALLNHEKLLLNNSSDSLKRHSNGHLRTASGALKDNVYTLQSRTLAILRTPLVDLKGIEGRLDNAAGTVTANNKGRLKECENVLRLYPVHALSAQYQKLIHYEAKTNLLDPVNVLRRGYSITYLNGKVVKEREQVKPGDMIDTKLHSGSIRSTVDEAKEN